MEPTRSPEPVLTVIEPLVTPLPVVNAMSPDAPNEESLVWIEILPDCALLEKADWIRIEPDKEF